MDPKVILALVIAVEQLIGDVLTVVQNAGLSEDTTAAYVARIAAAQAKVPAPCVGNACDNPAPGCTDGGCAGT